jgi:glycosyltransferase involved in cell wall biosynthesis
MSKPPPLVSVVLPAYNAEAFIAETLRSVLSQTYSNFEVLVVDDGSQDLTAAVVKTMASQDSRIKLLRQSNQGVAAARNLAIERSGGDYIAPLDADDVWYPTKLEKQVACLEAAGPKAGLAYVWCVSIDEKGRFIAPGTKWDLEGKVYEPLVLRNFIGNASVPLFRRNFLQKVGGYNSQLKLQDAQGCEDWELCLRLAEVCEFRVVQEYLAGYRCYNLSMSYDHEAMGKSYALVLQEVQRRHPEVPAHVYKWSKGMFYLYLAGKSNACGDIRDSFKWILRGLREDWAVLLLPWVNASLLKGCLRLLVSPFAYLIWGDQRRAWKRIRQQWSPGPTQDLSYDEIVAASKEFPTPSRVWDRVQTRRWANITKYRSFSC